MSAHETTHDAGPREPAGHETRDVAIRPVVLGGLGLLAAVALTGLLGLVLHAHYLRREAAKSPPPNPLAAEYAPRVPPPPRLQTDPLDDLRALRAAEDALLHGYAWADRGAGTVRIPIDRAMELLAERGRAGVPRP